MQKHTHSHPRSHLAYWHLTCNINQDRARQVLFSHRSYAPTVTNCSDQVNSYTTNVPSDGGKINSCHTGASRVLCSVSALKCVMVAGGGGGSPVVERRCRFAATFGGEGLSLSEHARSLARRVHPRPVYLDLILQHRACLFPVRAGQTNSDAA